MDVCSKTMGRNRSCTGDDRCYRMPDHIPEIRHLEVQDWYWADWFKIEQSKYSKRLLLCVPLLGAGAIIGHLDYTIVWRYFSWTNQTLAMIVLWTASMYLFREKKNYWLTAVPATFMSAVSMTYFFYAKEMSGTGNSCCVSGRYHSGSRIPCHFPVCNEKTCESSKIKCFHKTQTERTDTR